MKKKFEYRCFVVLVFVLVSFLSMPSYLFASSKKYELNVSIAWMESHAAVRIGIKPWMDEVEELSSGRLKTNYFNPNTIAPNRLEWESVLSGTLDMGGFIAGHTPGRFPLQALFELPFLFPSAEVGAKVLWQIGEIFPEWREEFKGAKLLSQWVTAPIDLHTVNRPIQKLEDLKGLRIVGRTPEIREVIRRLGANPIDIHVTEIYLALERGMVDGVMSPIAPLRSFKHTDAVKHTTLLSVGVAPFWFAMNERKFNRLPSDLQKILIETTGLNLARRCGQALDQTTREDSIWMKSIGISFYQLPDAEMARWRELVMPIHEDFLQTMEKQGYKNIRKIHSEVIRLSEKFSK